MDGTGRREFTRDENVKETDDSPCVFQPRILACAKTQKKKRVRGTKQCSGQTCAPKGGVDREAKKGHSWYRRSRGVVRKLRDANEKKKS